MNDRFKFRAYNKELRKMYEVNSICPYEDNYTKGGEVFLNGIQYVSFYFPEEVEVMQCTGLKDKNGKLIYEGDILDLYISTKKLYRYQVKYEIGSFMLVSDKEFFDFRNKWNDNVYPLSQLYFEYDNEDNCIWHCEVIGNIYENKELLND